MKSNLPTVALLLCAGCTAGPSASHLPVRSFVPTIALTALAKGRLTVRNGCIRIGDALIVWPLGSRLVKEGDRQFVVIDDRRYAVGSYVSLGGGGSATAPTGLAAPLPPGCDGPFFLAN